MTDSKPPAPLLKEKGKGESMAPQNWSHSAKLSPTDECLASWLGLERFCALLKPRLCKKIMMMFLLK